MTSQKKDVENVLNSINDNDSNTSSDSMLENEEFIPHKLGKTKLKYCYKNSKSPTKKKWYRDVAVNLRDYGYQSAGYSWMHDRDAVYYNGVFTKLTLWAAILSTITTTGIAAVITIVDTQHIWLMYLLLAISILLSLSAAILNVWKLTYNYTLKIQEHSEKSAKFGKLFRKIKNQFSLEPVHRYDAQTLLDYTTDRFNELDRERPFIRPSTIKKWDKQAVLNENGDPLYDKILQLPSEYNNNSRGLDDETVINMEGNQTKDTKTINVNRWIKNML